MAQIGLQLLGALEAAHSSGIVHRDVKPGNVMVSHNGRVKLTDFGIAQAIDDPRLTSTGSVIGSVSYMSPERLSGNTAGPEADLWALGATLFFAVEGWEPFERETTAATLTAVLHETPYLTQCHGPLATAITGMLIGAPEARLSAPQARNLLQAAAANPETSTVPQHGQPASTMRYTAAQPQSVHSPAQQGGSGPAGRVGWGQLGWDLRGKLIGLALVVALVAFGIGMVTHWLGSRGPATAPLAQLQPTMTYGPQGDVPSFEGPSSSSSDRCALGGLEPGRSISAEAACDEPHDMEVYYWASPSRSNDDAPYQGQEALARYGEGACSGAFQSPMLGGAGVDKNDLRFAALIPTEGAWNGDDDNNRRLYCILWRADGAQLERSLLRPDS